MNRSENPDLGENPQRREAERKSLPDSERRGSDFETNEMSVHLKIGYKTILLVFVLFDVIGAIARELVNLLTP